MTRRGKIVAVAVVLLLACLIIWEIRRDRRSALIFAPTWLLISLGANMRPPTVVSATGIHRPLRRYSHLNWSAVDTVAAPAPEFHSVRLNLVNGPTISLADIPATESAAVAALGKTN